MSPTYAKCGGCGAEIGDPGLCSACHWDSVLRAGQVAARRVIWAYADRIDAELVARYFETHCHVCGSPGAGSRLAAPRLTFAGIDVLCKACEALAKAFGDALPKSRVERNLRRLMRRRAGFNSFDDFFADLFGRPACSSA